MDTCQCFAATKYTQPSHRQCEMTTFIHMSKLFNNHWKISLGSSATVCDSTNIEFQTSLLSGPTVGPPVATTSRQKLTYLPWDKQHFSQLDVFNLCAEEDGVPVSTPNQATSTRGRCWLAPQLEPPALPSASWFFIRHIQSELQARYLNKPPTNKTGHVL